MLVCQNQPFPGLFQCHTTDSLHRFYAEHRELLLKCTLVIVLPSHCDDGCGRVELLPGWSHPVLSLDDRRYVFLTAADQAELRQRPRDDRRQFMKLFGASMVPLRGAADDSSDASTTTMVVKKRQRDSAALMVLEESNTNYRIELALAAQRERELVARSELEKQLLEERHAAEKERLRQDLLIHYQQQQLQFLLHQQQLGVGGGGAGASQKIQVNRTVTMNDWLFGKQYPQDLSRLSLTNVTRWFNLFENPQVTAHALHNNIIVQEGLSGHTLRLLLPLTYRYNLKRVLALLLQSVAPCDRTSVQTIIDACPDRYTVVLYGGVDTPELKHRINCTTLALHCHLVMSVVKINHDNARKKARFSPVLHESQVPPYRVPSLELLALHYPSSVYFGPDTYLTHDFTIPLKQHKPLEGGGDDSRDEDDDSGEDNDDDDGEPQRKKQRQETATTKGMGTGHNKCCPYCCFPARTLSQGDSYKMSHHPINCPAIALCSRNEAELLGHVRARCVQSLQAQVGKKKKRVARHRLFVGRPLAQPARQGKADDVAFNFDTTTLFRHTTGEEETGGQHFNGLRVNRQRHATMLASVLDTLRVQLEGPLFGQLHGAVARLMGCFYDMECAGGDSHALPPLRTLLYDEFGEKFLKKHYPAEAKKPASQPVLTDSALYFSLDSTSQLAQHNAATVTVQGVPQTVYAFFLTEYQAERMQQHCFVTPV